MGGVELTPDQIYDLLKNKVPGNAPLFHAQSAAADLEQKHTDLVNRIDALNRRMDAAWQGQAGQAAQSGAHPLSASLDQSALDLLNAKTYLTHQSSAYNTACAKVQPVPPASQAPQNGFWNEVTPWHTDLDSKLDAYNSNVDANKQAFTEYHTASTDNGGKIPQQYGTLQTSAASVAVAPNPGTGSGSYGGYTGHTGSSTGSWAGGSYGGGGYTPPPGPIGGGGPVPVGGRPGPVPQPYRPPVNAVVPIGNDPAGFRPGDPGFNPNPGGPGFNSGPGSPGPNSGPGGGGFLGGGGFGGGAGSFGSGGSAGGAGGGFGSRGSGGFGPKGSGGANGVGGGGAEEGATGRSPGGVGAAGKSGSAGAGGMGAGGKGGKGEEDGEHRSASYLQDDYSGEIVGDLGLTAPPVIGE